MFSQRGWLPAKVPHPVIHRRSSKMKISFKKTKQNWIDILFHMNHQTFEGGKLKYEEDHEKNKIKYLRNYANDEKKLLHI